MCATEWLSWMNVSGCNEGHHESGLPFVARRANPQVWTAHGFVLEITVRRCCPLPWNNALTTSRKEVV